MEAGPVIARIVTAALAALIAVAPAYAEQQDAPVRIVLKLVKRAPGPGVRFDPESCRVCTPVTEASTGQPYDFRIYYEVTAPVTGTWKTFIHIDANRRRFNGDHDTLQGKYPFRYWGKGDFVMDVHPVEFEPHFAGANYDVYFGLFAGDKRMAVKHGKHTDNRIVGGKLFIR